MAFFIKFIESPHLSQLISSKEVDQRENISEVQTYNALLIDQKKKNHPNWHINFIRLNKNFSMTIKNWPAVVKNKAKLWNARLNMKGIWTRSTSNQLSCEEKFILDHENFILYSWLAERWIDYIDQMWWDIRKWVTFWAEI